MTAGSAVQRHHIMNEKDNEETGSSKPSPKEYVHRASLSGAKTPKLESRQRKYRRRGNIFLRTGLLPVEKNLTGYIDDSEEQQALFSLLQLRIDGNHQCPPSAPPRYSQGTPSSDHSNEELTMEMDDSERK